MHKIRATNDSDGTEIYVEVSSIDTRGVRLLRVGGLATAQVREVSEDERQEVVDLPYAAAWLGWHSGQVPAYGKTPEQAVRKLALGQVAS